MLPLIGIFSLQRRQFVQRVFTSALFVACAWGLAANTAMAQSARAAKAAAKPAAGPAVHILVVGDSISAEYGLPRGSGWVALLQKKLDSSKKKYTVINASISGDTSAGGRARFAQLLAKHKPRIVLLELGANDALRGLSLQQTQSNLNAMVQAAQKNKAQVVLLGMQVPPNYGAQYTKDFAQTFEKVSKQNKAHLVPFLLKGVADAPNSMQWFQSDRIHPNERAQAQLLNNVWPVLQPLL